MSAAHAADVAQPVEASGFNWSGLYVGFGVGAGANVHEISSDFIPGLSLNGIGGEGVYGEATVGYDYMVSQRFLLGGLIDAHFGNIETSLDAFGLSASIQETYGFDAGLRAGYLFTPNTLGYVLGGYSWQKYKLDTNAGFDLDWDQGGYFVGAGVETAVAGNWTIKGEYRYTRFATNDDLLSEFGAPDGFLNLDTSRHTFQVAANYRFGAQNGGGAAFEAPAYSWTGFYVGGGLGAGASVHQLDVPPAGVTLNGIGGEGVFGEASIGYDQDFGSWVAGVMVDARYSGMTSKVEVPGGQINLDTDYGFDVLGRLGMKVNESTPRLCARRLQLAAFRPERLGAHRRHPRLGLQRLLGGWRCGNGRIEQHDGRSRISLLAIRREGFFGGSRRAGRQPHLDALLPHRADRRQVQVQLKAFH